MPTDSIPNEFQRKCLDLINSLIQVSGSAFFLVEPGMQHRGNVSQDLDPGMDKEYTKHFAMMDPLNPENFSNSDVTVVSLDSQISPHILKQTIYYQEFMAPRNHRYAADIFFRNDERIIAVLALLREESLGNFTSDEIELLKKIQPFLEYSLNSVYLAEKIKERTSIKDMYGFTDREVEVLEMLLVGMSNKQIANELDLGLATIKTHLHHIFQKAGTDSRSELLAKMYSVNRI